MGTHSRKEVATANKIEVDLGGLTKFGFGLEVVVGCGRSR